METEASPRCRPGPQGLDPRASTRAPLQNPSASSGPARASDDGGIELPEQTYSQTLERTVGE